MSKHSEKERILLLGCSTKAGYFVAKHFYENGFIVDVINWVDLPNKHSKFVRNYFLIPSPEKNLQAALTAITNKLASTTYCAMVPIHDAALEIARNFRQTFETHCKLIGLNDDSAYAYAHNKFHLLREAEQLGIACPKTTLITSLDDLALALPKIKYPCIVKPVSSAILANQQLYTFSVKKVLTPLELEDTCRELIENAPIMLQEVIEGYGIGYNFFAIKGEVQCAYIHKRITEHAGISSYRETLTPNHFNTEKQINSLLLKSGWTGIGMVEFKVWNDVPYLMEFNGRFFGSVELSRINKINLAGLFIKLHFGDLPKTYPPAKAGTKARNLHDEILLYTARLANGNLLLFVSWLASVVKTIISPKEIIEDNVLADPRFVWAQYRYDIKRILAKRARRKLIAKKIINRRLLGKNDLQSNAIVFICKGNICRSPFAEYYLKKDRPELEVHSAGTYSTPNRLSPVNALLAAIKTGNISLQTHRSKYFLSVKTTKAPLYVVMDRENYFDLLTLGIDGERIRFLCDSDIEDPYGKSEAFFQSTYQKITESLIQLI